MRKLLPLFLYLFFLSVTACVNVTLICTDMDCKTYSFENHINEAKVYANDSGLTPFGGAPLCYPTGSQCLNGSFAINGSIYIDGQYRYNVISARPNEKGTVANFTATIYPSLTDLHGFVGIEDGCTGGDGVLYRIQVDGVDVWNMTISTGEWREFSAPFGSFSNGQAHNISLITEPISNQDCDHSVWDELELTSSACCMNGEYCVFDNTCYLSTQWGADVDLNGKADFCSYGIWQPLPFITSITCGDSICTSPLETNTTCPRDCCLINRDDECENFEACGSYDPDCCASNSCVANRFICQNNTRGNDCYPGTCVAGATPTCTDSCAAYNSCTSGFCGGGLCRQECVANGSPAFDLQSCCNCFSGGYCQACTDCVNITNNGFYTYQGKDLTINYEIQNNCATYVTNLVVSVSGPLKDYITFKSRDTEWNNGVFTFISPGSKKYLQAVISGLPNYIYGMKQVKLSATHGTDQTASFSYVAVLPAEVIRQGRDPPRGVSVGTSRLVTLMKKGNLTLPVEVTVSVW